MRIAITKPFIYLLSFGVVLLGIS
ncbi:MAG: hypothetical protein K0R09_142, partial [Clostridiales bacterium]|nr:hypothetical protein [Clostridiales bacterium]